MSGFIEPIYNVKIKSDFEDYIECSELDENKLILMQFEGEEDSVYICLNDTQIKVDLVHLSNVVQMLSNNLNTNNLNTNNLNTNNLNTNNLNTNNFKKDVI